MRFGLPQSCQPFAGDSSSIHEKFAGESGAVIERNRWHLGRMLEGLPIKQLLSFGFSSVGSNSLIPK